MYSKKLEMCFKSWNTWEIHIRIQHRCNMVHVLSKTMWELLWNVLSLLCKKSFIFYYHCALSGIIISFSFSLFLRKKEYHRNLFVSRSIEILIPRASAGQLHPEAVENNVVDKWECKLSDGLSIDFAIWLCQESFYFNIGLLKTVKTKFNV